MSLAKSYASALFESATERGTSNSEIEGFSLGLRNLQALLDNSKELRFALLSPAVSVKERVSVVESIRLKLQLSPALGAFLALLARKNRLRYLASIELALRKATLESEGKILGEVVSADTMSDSDLKELAQAFSKKLEKKIVFQTRVDATLLAGIRVTVGGITYDGTLRSQLNQLKEINKR